MVPWIFLFWSSKGAVPPEGLARGAATVLDCKTKTRSGCSSVQNPLWAHSSPFCKTQSYPRPTKSGTVCIPASLIRPTTLPWAYSTQLPTLSGLKAFLSLLFYSAWKALPQTAFVSSPLFPSGVCSTVPFIKEPFTTTHITHTHTPL